MKTYQHHWHNDPWDAFAKELMTRRGVCTGSTAAAPASGPPATPEQIHVLQQAHGVWQPARLGLDQAAAAALIAQLVEEGEAVAAARAFLERGKACRRELAGELLWHSRIGSIPQWVQRMGIIVERAWPHRLLERLPSGRFQPAAVQPARTVADDVAFPDRWSRFQERLTADRNEEPVSPRATRDQEQVIVELAYARYLSLRLTVAEANGLIRRLTAEYEQWVRRDEMWVEVRAEQAAREERRKQDRREKAGWAPGAKIAKWPASRWLAYLTECQSTRGERQPAGSPPNWTAAGTEKLRNALRGLHVPEEVVVALLESEMWEVWRRHRDEKIAAVRARQRRRRPQAGRPVVSPSQKGTVPPSPPPPAS